jgi:hypothetical protein
MIFQLKFRTQLANLCFKTHEMQKYEIKLFILLIQRFQVS